MSEPKYPEITMRLVGENGIAFHILGLCLSAMRRAATITTYSSPA